MTIEKEKFRFVHRYFFFFEIHSKIKKIFFLFLNLFACIKLANRFEQQKKNKTKLDSAIVRDFFVFFFFFCFCKSINGINYFSALESMPTIDKLDIPSRDGRRSSDLMERFSKRTAISMAQLAYAAYYAYEDSKQFVDRIVGSRIGLLSIEQFYATDTEINGFVGKLEKEPNEVVVGFTGTQFSSPKTVSLDLDQELVKFVTGGKVSRGFSKAWRSVRDIIFEYLSGMQRISCIWVVGHSLGGAIATLCSAELKRAGPSVDVVTYTFASPRVGDYFFSTAYNRLGIHSNRIQNYWDIIPRLPEREGEDRVHVEKLILLKDCQCIANSPPPTDYLFDIESWYQQHRLTTYMRLLQRCKKVEYMS
jgi:hypothetical protein